MDLLEPVNLLRRIRLGCNSLLGGLDPTQKNLPYWNCGFKDGDLSGYRQHGAWDRCHDVARAIHGLSMSEEATGERVDEAIMKNLAEHLFALFDGGDGLPGTQENGSGKRFVNLHNVREAMHALGALAKRHNGRAKKLAHQLVKTVHDAIDENGKIRLERLPNYIEKYNHQPSQEGRAVDALVRYFRVTGYETSLELASLLTKFALENCFTPSGTLTEEAGTHGHSITALVAGMLDLALLTKDADLLLRVKAIYDVGLPRFNSSFGWSMESLTKFILRGESNNTGDLLRGALLLGTAGFPEYFGRAERILRGHLLPSQVIDVAGFSDDPNAEEDRFRSMASRIRGGFSFPTPNDYLFAPDAPIVTYDITSGAVDGLCETLWKTITVNESTVRINLLLDCDSEGVRIRSHLSGKGQIDIENYGKRNLLLRIPGWVSPSAINVKLDGTKSHSRFVGSYLMIPSGAQRASVMFPMHEARTMESIVFNRFTIDWRGDQIVAMSPPAEHLPFIPACKLM